MLFRSAIVAALPDSLQPRSRLAELADEMGSKVHDLQRQNHRSSELLTSAIDQARRTRSFLLRLNGSTPTYSAPVLTTP